jgi:hypothetical protein
MTEMRVRDVRNERTWMDRAACRRRWAARAAVLLGAALAVATAAGCEKEGIRAYDVAKSDDPIADSLESTPQPPADMGSMMPTEPSMENPEMAPPSASDPVWTVPAEWTRSSEQRPMRHATFIVEDPDGQVEVSVSQFPGDVGGMLANVNRWRGQVGLGPVGEADLPSIVTPFTSPGFEGHTMRLAGEGRTMLAASIFEPSSNRTWFVKATVSPAAADRVETDLFEFARSFRAETTDASPDADPAADDG